MKKRIVLGTLLLVFAASFMAMGCHEKLKEEPTVEPGVTEPIDETPETPVTPVVDEKDTTAPSVVNVSPAPNATGVAINTAISVTFSEAVKAETINRDTFQLIETGGNKVEGDVSYSGVTAVFKPKADLAADKDYLATVSKDVIDLAGNKLGEIFKWSFKTGSVAEKIAPMVTRIQPKDGSPNVPIGTQILIGFSEEITYKSDAFALKKNDGANIVGEVVYVNRTATFTPATPLESSSSYIFTAMADRIFDLSDNKMENDFTSSFSTAEAAALPDTTPPTILGIIPAPGNDSSVPLNTKFIITFSEVVDPQSVNAHSIYFTTIDGTPLPWSVTLDYFMDKVVVTPNAMHTPCLLVILNNITDLAGNKMAQKVENLYSSNLPANSEKPTVTQIIPANNATDVTPDVKIQIKFSELMNPTTITPNVFYLQNTSASEEIAGKVVYDNATNTAIFEPTTQLSPNSIYRFVVKHQGIAVPPQDLCGNGLQFTSGVSQIQFTTAAQ